MVLFSGDLVCWDFGDTLVDQTFMRRVPSDIPGWATAYETVRQRTDQADRWDLAESTMRELATLLAAELGMNPGRIWRQLAHNLVTIDPFEESIELMRELQGNVLQAIVTVNPHEFSAMAVACGLHELVDCIVTSADLASLSKVDMANAARSMLQLTPGLSTTLLIDNKEPNVTEFIGAGGMGWVFDRRTFAADRSRLFG